MMNPLQMFGQMFGQISQTQNPMQMMLQMFGNNPVMNRAIQMSQGKTEEQMKETVKNLGKQAGIDVEQMANMFGLKL